MKKAIITISIVLFVFSLTQKCYCTTAQCGDSVMVFLLGWFAVFKAGAGITWIANPLLFASWFTIRKNVKASVVLSFLATCFALSFLLFDSILANETGHYQQIISYKAGYYFWVLSCVATLTGSFILRLKRNNKKVS